MKSQVYNQAKYYEIAFSFVDSKKQADLFEKFIKKFSKIEVKSVLDVACGTALQLRKLAKKGYKTIGLDISPKMVDYLRKESLKEDSKIKVIKADMNFFKFFRRFISFLEDLLKIYFLSYTAYRFFSTFVGLNPSFPLILSGTIL